MFTPKYITKRNHVHISVCILPYVTKFYYFLFVSPFKIIRNNSFYLHKSNSLCFVHTYFPQKFLCGLLTGLSTYGYITEFLRSEPHETKNPTTYFMLVVYIINIFQRVLNFKLLWCEQQKIVKLISSFENWHSRTISIVIK